MRQILGAETSTYWAFLFENQTMIIWLSEYLFCALRTKSLKVNENTVNILTFKSLNKSEGDCRETNSPWSSACHLTHYESLIHGKVLGCAPSDSKPTTLARVASVWFGFAVLRPGRWNFPLLQRRKGVRGDEGRLKQGREGEENHRYRHNGRAG